MDAQDRDFLIRTVIGEAANEPDAGQAAVAHVVLNRLASGKWGDTARSVVLAPSQFEPWSTRANELMGIDPNSPAYQRAANIVDGVVAGKIPDPTGGMTHFLNPDVVRQRFGTVPRWAQGQAIRIGQHDFYAPEGFVTRPETALDAINKAAPVASDLKGAGVQPLAFASTDKAQPMPTKTPKDPDLSAFETQFGLGGKAQPQTAPDPTLSSFEKQFGLGGAASAGKSDPKTGETVVGGAPMDANKGKFNAAVSFANGVLQGGGVPLMAAAAAAKEKLLRGGDFGNLYDQAKSVYAGNRADYQRDNPVTGIGSEIAGSVASSIPAFIAAGPVVAGAARGAGMAPAAVDFLAGTGGGNALMRAASIGTNAALTGAAGGALSSGLSDMPIGQQVALGAALGPVGPAAFGAAKYVGGGLDAAIQPFTSTGRNAIADRVIAEAAANGPTAARSALIPGVEPMLAESTGNPGVAALHRAVRGIAPYTNEFVAREEANAAARSAALAPLVGDATTVDALRTARDATAGAIRKGAFQGAQPVVANDVLSTIDGILASPSGQRDAVTKALGNIRSKLIQHEITMPDGSKMYQLLDDPKQLYGLRQQITDLLSPLARNADSAPQLASRELGQVKDALDRAIESGAPGYRQYLSTFADMSKPIDVQTFLQKKNLTDAKGNLTLQKVDSAIKDIQKQQALPGAQKAKSIGQGELDLLTNLRDSLRQASDVTKGKAFGSDTVQNLATNNLMARLGVPAALLGNMVQGNHLGAFMAWLGRQAYNRQNPAILDALTSKLLDAQMPQGATNAIMRAANPMNLNPVSVPLGLGGVNIYRTVPASPEQSRAR